jgi:hypothetical protein
MSANSSLCDWLRRPLTEYASFNFSNARTKSLVSCLYDKGLKKAPLDYSWLEGKNLREGDGSELPTLQPVNCRSIDSYGFFGTNVRAILQVAVLPLLFSLEIETCWWN